LGLFIGGELDKQFSDFLPLEDEDPGNCPELLEPLIDEIIGDFEHYSIIDTDK
jgi:hypothetical protein